MILHVSLFFSDIAHTVSFNELSNICKQKDSHIFSQNFITSFLKNGSLQLDRSFKETKKSDFQTKDLVVQYVFHKNNFLCK